jgi:hypothetical protein
MFATIEGIMPIEHSRGYRFKGLHQGAQNKRVLNEKELHIKRSSS